LWQNALIQQSDIHRHRYPCHRLTGHGNHSRTDGQLTHRCQQRFPFVGLTTVMICVGVGLQDRDKRLNIQGRFRNRVAHDRSPSKTVGEFYIRPNARLNVGMCMSRCSFDQGFFSSDHIKMPG